MLYGQRLREIGEAYAQQERAVERLSFCYDVYAQFVERQFPATEHMDATKATNQLIAAVRAMIQRPE